ncbi:MAG TPA: polysaccharide deacetylase family protein [Solirubrobacteraceae bacterium]|jgi:peptidoglycan/xylan/chitin deacetylase (PgdA/CDA1 family)|nr:polysaccharide deacetylase family protein [Solirubrobacteraceae bacterium]
MTRWDWTWEERSQKTRTPTVEQDSAIGEDTTTSSGGGGGPPGRAPQTFRRRRAGAGGMLIVLVVLLIAALTSHNDPKSAARVTVPHVAAVTPDQAQRAAATFKAEQRAINSVLAYTPAVTSGGLRGNEVALTFDDGPGPYTPQLVAELNRLHVHATFFAIGNQERYFSAGTVNEVNSGDVIGDHTESHPMMASLSPHDQHEQLFEQMVQVEVLGAKRPRLFRPPYGSFNATTFRELHHLHLLMVLWSVDTADYTLPGTRAIVERALAGARPGAIILMHDAGGNRSETIAALPAIVKGLRKRGLHPVTVPQLLMDDPPPHGQPIPTSLTGG